MKNKVIYISYDGILEPIGQSQILCYIKKLAFENDITLISYEKKRDIKSNDTNQLKIKLKKLNIDCYFLKYNSYPKNISTIYDILKGFFLIFYLIYVNKIRILHSRSYIAGIMSLLISVFF